MFRKLITPSLLILILGFGVAVSQTISKSVQLSQDPSGPIGFDTNNNVYFPAHILTTGPGAPTVSSPAGTAPTVTGTDFAGTITGGSSANTTATVTFNKAFLATPNCVAVSQNPSVSPVSYNLAPTGINITSSLAASIVNWVCSGAK